MRVNARIIVRSALPEMRSIAKVAQLREQVGLNQD
jgi:hypothetical protein